MASNVVRQSKDKLGLRLILVCLFVPTILCAQGPISDTQEMTALLDFYNSTSQNDGSPWVSNYRWNRNLLREALGLEIPPSPTQSFDDFELVFNASNQTYTSSHLPGVTLNANKDVVSIMLSSEANIRGAIPPSFNNLTELRILSITSFSPHFYHNEITGVLPNLSGLSKLTDLSLPGNDCTGIVDWLGVNGGNLTSVDLSSNSSTSGTYLTVYATASFQNMKDALSSLTLNDNRLTTNLSSINNEISVHFRHLDKLKTLNLIGCNLNSTSFIHLGDAAFDGMASLETLRLSLNPIINVPSQLAKLTSLKSLYLIGVQLQSLHIDFSLLDNLTTLDLSSNDLTNNIAFSDIVNVLKDCQSLSTLSLSENNFSDVTENFDLLTALRTLNLNLNPIGSSNLTNLEGSQITSLSLQACMLTTTLPTTLLNLTGLTTLDLSNYVLSPSHTDPRRNWLDLSSIAVENVLKNFQDVKNLSLAWHAIAGPGVLPAWFGTGSMNEIEVLDLTYNQIQLPLPASFTSMDSLKILKLGYNSMSGSLPSTFNCASFSNLVSLDLSYNTLTSIPDLENCDKLEVLNLQTNSLGGSLPSYFQSKLPKLFSLNISSNSFTSMPNLADRSNHLDFDITLTHNLFDFGDLDELYDGSCNRKLRTIAYLPQKPQLDKKGDPVSFSMPEGLPITLQFQAPGANNYYEWKKPDGSDAGLQFEYNPWPHLTNDSYSISNLAVSDAGVYHTNIRNRCLPGLTFTGNDVHLIIIPPLCETEIPNRPGVFKLDKLTGAIVFERNDCPTKIPVSCAFGPVATIDNVVSAKAITHSDNWSYKYLNVPVVENLFESGERGKWRQKASYVQTAALVQSNDKNYNAGTFKFKAFNYKHGEKSNYPGWLKVNQIEKYSQHGQPVEEYNAVNIPSAAKFGYRESVPYLVAQNATYQSVLFESFENVYNSTTLEDGLLINGGTIESGTKNFHSGKAAFRLAGSTSISTREFQLNSQLNSRGAQVKVWVKGAATNTLQVQVFNASNTLVGTSPFTWVASSGEWSLYESILLPSAFSSLAVCPQGTYPCLSTSLFTIKLNYTGGSVIYLDDLRIQPKDAEMTTYVYDPSTLRLLTVFDDQHFGLYYQYNAEGKLVRKIIETERGLKTVQETQYNSQKTDANP